jgi:hypothetical protein
MDDFIIDMSLHMTGKLYVAEENGKTSILWVLKDVYDFQHTADQDALLVHLYCDEDVMSNKLHYLQLNKVITSDGWDNVGYGDFGFLPSNLNQERLLMSTIFNSYEIRENIKWKLAM